MYPVAGYMNAVKQWGKQSCIYKMKQSILTLVINKLGASQERTPVSQTLGLLGLAAKWRQWRQTGLLSGQAER